MTAVIATPAQGSFAVEDDPAFGAGNRRRVVFTPALPGDPNAPCTAGLESLQNYQVIVAAGPSAPNVVVVGGERLQSGAFACFATCGCPAGGGCASRFADVIPGAPYVVDTTPATSDPAPPGVDRCAIAGNTIQIRISEPLDPAGVNLANVRVVNAATGVQLPGFLVFHQAASPAGTSRIDYVLAITPLGGVTYQVLLGPGLTDFGGNPVEPAQGNAAAQLFFQTSPVASTPQPPLVESFESPNPAGATGVARWTGDGALKLLYPFELAGTGADGAFNPLPGTTVMNTDELVSGQSRKGIWNFTSVNIPANATARFVGPYQAHVRCTGSFTVDGIIDASAAMGPFTSVQPYDRGPQPGIAFGSGGPDCESNGGVGNAGGGAGGTGSGITPPPGIGFPFQCTIRALKGEDGYGPPLDGVLNTGSPPNAFYGAGQGGDSGCFPFTATLDCVVGDLGGLGGAGGSAGRPGEAGIPRQATAACSPTPGVVQPIAQPGPVPPAMIPPIALQSAGSGGGGGGDHLENTGTPPNNDHPGAGAGGGGGGLRISCVGPYSQGTVPTPFTGTITARGAPGNTAQAQGGAGGSGSGGEVWIQSFSTVTISATSTVDVTGPARFGMLVGAIGCSNQAAGGGGAGLVQIEAGQGPAVTPGFNLVPTPTATTGAVFSAPPFAYAAGIAGQGKSGFRFAASSPDYTGAMEVFNLGDAPGAILSIRYEGALEAIDSTPGNPIYAPATIKSTTPGGAPITAANLDELDGYPFIQFVVDLSAPNPPATPPSAILPSVDSIAINFNAQAPCP